MNQTSYVAKSAVSLSGRGTLSIGQYLAADIMAQFAQAIAEGSGGVFMNLSKEVRDTRFPYSQEGSVHICGDWRVDGIEAVEDPKASQPFAMPEWSQYGRS